MVQFCSRDTQYKRPFGAVKSGVQVELRLRLPARYALHQAVLVLYDADGEAAVRVPLEYDLTEPDGSYWLRCAFPAPAPGLYFYDFELIYPDRSSKRLVRGQYGWGYTAAAGERFQLTVYDPNFTTPDFIKGGVLYQIFPDRFAASGTPKRGVPSDRFLHGSWYELPHYLPDARGEITNSDYFGGDLRGITEKLDYLQALSVSCIYLNPIFEAHSNHRYNTADYLKIDPLLGDEEDFRILCQEAKRRGISVILDGVFSHTGSDSRYFNREGRYNTVGACNSMQSPYYKWYRFSHWPDRYDCWWGFVTLPNVDEVNPDYLDFICGEDGVLAHWLSAGAAGFRLDVADELPDGFLDALRARVKAENPDALVVGEVWEDASNKVAYGHRRRYLNGRQLDSVMNYPFKDAILHFLREGGAGQLREAVETVVENYPEPVVHCLMNSLSTHDTVRALTALAGEELGKHPRQWQAEHHFFSAEQYAHGRALLVLAGVLQYLLPGVPCTYYGDERGMTGYRDPFNRCTMPWGDHDEGLVEVFRALGTLRRQNPMLAHAAYRTVHAEGDLFCFVREGEGERLLVAVNRGGQGVPFALPPEYELLFGPLQGGYLPLRAAIVARLRH